jgi:hypothetical protein
MKNNHTITKIPLIIIVIGTILLALPASLGSLYIFGGLFNHTFNPAIVGMAAVVVLGYGLLIGYIYTLITMRYFAIFWTISMLYNLGMAIVSGYYIFSAFGRSSTDTLIFLLFPLWTLFVSVASGYYLFQSLTAENKKLR